MGRKNKKRGVRSSPRKKAKTPQSAFDMGTELADAQELHRSGRLAEAEGFYRKILDRHPAHPDTLHLLGILAIQVGRNDIAANLIQQAVREAPRNPLYQSNLGNALKALGKTDEAVACYRKAIRLRPDFADAYYNMATVFQDRGDLEDALLNYEKALSFKPEFANAHNNMGTILQARGSLSEAIMSYEKALELQPGDAETYNNLGTAFQKRGDHAQAIACFENAVKIRPDFADAHYNMGNILHGRGDLAGAVSCFQKAVDLRPNYAEAYYNMGTVLQDQDKLDAAIPCLQKAIELKPDFATAHNNLGNALLDLGRSSEALPFFEKAIEIKPDFAAAHNNRGNALKELGSFENALAAYRKACEIDPDFAGAYVNLGMMLKDHGQTESAISNFQKALELEPEMADALSHLTHQFQHVCDWEQLSVMNNRLDNLTRKALKAGERTAETPFINISRHGNPELNLAVARSWSDDIARRSANLKPSFTFHGRRSNHGKITIGYLSNNFRNHPMAHIMRGLFRLHDRNMFNIFCYSSGKDDGSHYRKQIQADCDRFVDLRHVNTMDSAERIHQDRVDILVDLMGHTKDDRLDICSLRPAPIQSRYLGMAGTTGSDFFDYIIADSIVIPEQARPYYSENPVWLPHCYQVNDRNQKISDMKWSRTDFGLPEEGFVFCSFNSSYKIDPVIFDAWARILLSLPGSVLWLLAENRTVENNLREAARARGVEPRRLIFAEKLPKDQHLARMGLADLVLDTRVVGGAASTSDALWAGVPVITMTGTHFASRMSTSILTAIGLPDLIARNLPQYEALAVELARNPDELRAVKRRLAENRLTKPLFDTLRFTRNLERAYKRMWELQAAGESPRPITVIENPIPGQPIPIR